MKLPKLTKAERELIIEDLLDWALGYADPQDVEAELRHILKRGLLFKPYCKISDADLILKLAEYIEPTREKDWASALDGYFKPAKAAKILKATKEYYE